jgi:hypothetical protein
MHISLLLGLPLPVLLAFGALVLVLLMVLRVAASLVRPVVVRQAAPAHPHVARQL